MGMPEIVNSGIKRDQAITDMIESVALQQTALSHILNAEGEKIQLIVKMKAAPDQMIEVNQSVNDMVQEITQLEMILQRKLGLFSNCLCYTLEDMIVGD